MWPKLPPPKCQKESQGWLSCKVLILLVGDLSTTNKKLRDPEREVVYEEEASLLSHNTLS